MSQSNVAGDTRRAAAQQLAQLLTPHARRRSAVRLLGDAGQFSSYVGGMAKEEINKVARIHGPFFGELKWGICGRKYGRIEKVFHLD